MSISGSWGLRLDLGYGVSEATLSQLYAHFWDSEAFDGPSFQMGQYRGIPAAAEGKLLLPEAFGGQQGKSYTKFEEDPLGYPPGWEIPLTLSLSVFDFDAPLPQNQGLYDYLMAQTRELHALAPLRMALIGDLASYYVDADMVSPDWVDVHQQAVLALILRREHPLCQELEGTPLSEDLRVLTQSQLKRFWSDDDLNTRQRRYKERLSAALHRDTQPLEWERQDR